MKDKPAIIESVIVFKMSHHYLFRKGAIAEILAR